MDSDEGGAHRKCMAWLSGSGDAVIRAPAGNSEIVITTTSRLAGAIHSLRWNGKEFIDSFDHGRQLQSAANFDLGGELRDEAFNPTEAGCKRDADGPTSTSRLLELSAAGSELVTVTQMAFWLRPGQRGAGGVAMNTTALSDHPVSCFPGRRHAGAGPRNALGAPLGVNAVSAGWLEQTTTVNDHRRSGWRARKSHSGLLAGLPAPNHRRSTVAARKVARAVTCNTPPACGPAGGAHTLRNRIAIGGFRRFP